MWTRESVACRDKMRETWSDRRRKRGRVRAEVSMRWKMTVLFTLLASSQCLSVHPLILHAFLVMKCHRQQILAGYLIRNQNMWINGLMFNIKAVLFRKIMFPGTLWLLSSGWNSKESQISESSSRVWFWFGSSLYLVPGWLNTQISQAPRLTNLLPNILFLLDLFLEAKN